MSVRTHSLMARPGTSSDVYKAAVLPAPRVALGCRWGCAGGGLGVPTRAGPSAVRGRVRRGVRPLARSSLDLT